MPAAAALPPSLPLLVCPFGRRYLRSMQSRMEEENRRGERLRSLMKIMISLKTYSSLPLAAAEKEGEEEEFSVKARYNAEREREKNAGREGGGPPFTASATVQLQQPLEIGKGWSCRCRRGRHRGKLCDRCTETEGWVWIAHSTGYLAPVPFRFNLNGPQCGLMLGSPTTNGAKL